MIKHYESLPCWRSSTSKAMSSWIPEICWRTHASKLCLLIKDSALYQAPNLSILPKVMISLTFLSSARASLCYSYLDHHNLNFNLTVMPIEIPSPKIQLNFMDPMAVVRYQIPLTFFIIDAVIQKWLIDGSPGPLLQEWPNPWILTPDSGRTQQPHRSTSSRPSSRTNPWPAGSDSS